MQIIKHNLNNIHNTINRAVEVLQAGGIIIYPTETCYGIGVDATNQTAVDKLLEYKSRRGGKPISVAVIDKKMAMDYVELNESAINLYDNYLPGPLTVVSKSLGKVAKGIETEQCTLGIRVPDYELVLKIVKKLGKPMTSTSANASYQKRPYTINDVLENISGKQKKLIDLIIDAGELPPKDSSTVVDTTLNDPKILRQGDIKLTNKVELVSQSPEDTQKIGMELIKKYSQYLGYKSIIFAMKGDLGVGKTEMSKGIAKGLGIEDKISSPTYIIEAEYDIPGVENSYLRGRNIDLIHIDTWRLFDTKELEELDFYNQVDKCNVFVIEWADKVTSILKKVSDNAIILWVEIGYGEGEEERNIEISDFK